MKRLLALLTAAAAAAFTGCGRGGDETPALGDGKHVESGVSDFQVLETPGEMFERTDKVAIVQVVDETWRGDFIGLPKVNFTLRVVEPMKNTTAGEVIKFTQRNPYPPITGPVEDLVQIGERYLVFLKGWKWPESGPMRETYSTWLGETVYRAEKGDWVQYGLPGPPRAAPARIGTAELSLILAAHESLLGSVPAPPAG